MSCAWRFFRLRVRTLDDRVNSLAENVERINPGFTSIFKDVTNICLWDFAFPSFLRFIKMLTVWVGNARGLGNMLVNVDRGGWRICGFAPSQQSIWCHGKAADTTKRCQFEYTHGIHTHSSSILQFFDRYLPITKNIIQVLYKDTWIANTAIDDRCVYRNSAHDKRACVCVCVCVKVCCQALF